MTNQETTIKKVGEWLKKFHFIKLKFKTSFLEAEFDMKEDDKDAAWAMYVQLITRITTQTLNPEDGDEKTALDSVYSLFKTTRDILTEKGRKAQNFSKIAVAILNQVVRPFTAKWHKLSLNDAFNNPEQCLQFRQELQALQLELRDYSAMLAEIADVEDICNVFPNEDENDQLFPME